MGRVRTYKKTPRSIANSACNAIKGNELERIIIYGALARLKVKGYPRQLHHKLIRAVLDHYRSEVQRLSEEVAKLNEELSKVVDWTLPLPDVDHVAVFDPLLVTSALPSPDNPAHVHAKNQSRC